MKNNITGVGVALVTPFTEKGEIDYDGLARIVTGAVDAGVDYLVALGTTAETPTLSWEERDNIVAYIKKVNAGRVPIVVGLGGYSTRDVIDKINKSDFEGITALLSVTPYYNKPTQEGLFRHYEAIAAESPVPVVLYNVPGRTGVNLSAETTLRIAEQIPNILGIKEACGLIPQMSRILKYRPDGFKVISGDDCLALPLAAIGGDGVISVAANAFPVDFCEMARAAERGDNSAASAIYMRLFEAMETLFEEGNPAGVKAALTIRGICGPAVRLPLVEVSSALYKKLEKLIAENRLR
ncbi:MAG: 4-hydroxy-tetrahydrodipicolinate synthase [Rikenellaceae bacterium]|nr:4-hydroxy-tetrahydrodipicolinate synthase [Rikenellaceae bacterium]